LPTRSDSQAETLSTSSATAASAPASSAASSSCSKMACEFRVVTDQVLAVPLVNTSQKSATMPIT
jgi:hypothetical protein